MAMAASLIVLAVIVGLAGLGLSRAQPAVSMTSVDGQLRELSNDCRALLASAPRDLADPASPPGASKTIVLSLPSDTGFVSFGSDGDEGAIIYEVHGARKTIALENVKFRKGIDKNGIVVPTRDHTVIEGGGRYGITMEYEYDRSLDQKYLVVYENTML